MSKKIGKKRCNYEFNSVKLLKKINLFTIKERRIMSLLKFTIKELKFPLFDDWFTRSPGSDNDYNIVRFTLPKLSSERYKNSVKWSAIVNWNRFVQQIKPPPKTSLNQFYEAIMVRLVNDR